MIKKIKFYQYAVSIDNDTSFSSLENIKDDNTEPTIIQNKIIKVHSFKVKRFSDRFFGLCIESGDLRDYVDTIVDTKDALKKKQNPREATQIELDTQFLILIDQKTQYIYLSNAKQKTFAQKQLADKTGKKVEISEIHSAESFEKNLDTISEISLSFEEMNLFNQNSLNIALNEDIYNYEADSVRVVFGYKHKKLTHRIASTIRNLMGDKYHYGKLSIIGKQSDGLNSIFKPEAILKYIELNVQQPENTNNIDFITTFNLLISQILENE